MKFVELSVLLPCHSLDDFPLYYEGEAADSLLAGWTAIWHPALIAAAGQAPQWHRVDDPPPPIEGRLVVVPSVSADRVSHDYVGTARAAGSLVIDDYEDRRSIVETALASLDEAPKVDESLAADFMALGHCRLQVELLTRQMRYSTNIDDARFNTELLAGASAAARGDVAEARQHLGNCFVALEEARKYFYPVDAYLIDLTLVDRSTPAADLAREVETGPAANLLATADVLEELGRNAPELLALISTKWKAGEIAVVGGESSESELPMLGPEAIDERIASGLRHYTRIAGQRPVVFGRRRYGVLPILPQILTRHGFIGTLHFTLDEGRFPLATQAKIRWEGCDGSVIDALGKLPRDAAKSETFLEFSRTMGETMDSDHVATLVFAHWPGAVSPWYDDFRRIARLSNVLGKFVTLESYFRESEAPGRITRFESDEYRAPYLRQAVSAGSACPISRGAVEYRRESLHEALSTVGAMRDLLEGRITPSAASSSASFAETARGAADDSCASQSDDGARQELAASLAALGSLVPRQSKSDEQGYLVVNPLSFSRRIFVDRDNTLAGTGANPGSKIVADVPPMGFAWAAASAARPKSALSAEENVLRNDFLEVVINRSTGGIQSVHDFRRRANRMSQQLAMRMPGPQGRPGDVWRDADETAVYTDMVADAIEVVGADSESAEIASSGRLVDAKGNAVARYRQAVQLWSGSRVARLKIELEPDTLPSGDPWNSYYAARFAWSDPDAELFRSLALLRMRTDAKRLEAPAFVEIVSARGSLAILPGGLAYHRRSGFRMLDSMLIVQGETCRTFELGLGVGLAQPASAALGLLAPPAVAPEPGPPPVGNPAVWLFQTGARSVVATHWEAIGQASAGDSASSGGATSAVVQGFRVRLLETSGRAGEVVLRCFKSPRSARRIDAQGKTLLELEVDDDKILLQFTAFEWIYVEATW